MRRCAARICFYGCKRLVVVPSSSRRQQQQKATAARPRKQRSKVLHLRSVCVLSACVLAAVREFVPLYPLPTPPTCLFRDVLSTFVFSHYFVVRWFRCFDEVPSSPLALGSLYVSSLFPFLPCLCFCFCLLFLLFACLCSPPYGAVHAKKALLQSARVGPR